MDDLKNIFGDKALTYDDFTAAVSSNENIQLANIAGVSIFLNIKTDPFALTNESV